MEYSFSPKEKGISHWELDREPRNPNEYQFGNISEMMNFEGYSGWCSSPSSTEQLLWSYGVASLSVMPLNYASCDQMNSSEQENGSFPVTCDDINSLNCLGSPPLVSSGENDSGSKQDDCFLLPHIRVPRSVSHSLSEKMLHALSLFKESTGRGILAQMWVPTRSSGQNLLSTCEQPYLLDEMLLGYREISRLYTFSAEEKPGCFPGLPGRVFISKIPEWTSNISYYSSAEYLRAQHARNHEVRGSVAIPIFSPSDGSCCAVLELVTVREKPNFDVEIESVCRAFEAVDLRTTAPPHLPPQHFSLNQKTALAEIGDVLRAVCHAHRLPLALTWIPCTLEEEDGEKVFRIHTRESNCNLYKKSILCIEETSCYVNDKEMQGFVHACSEHPLEEGQGVAGKALQSNIPFFYSDVKNYHIKEYPLVQHARKYGLSAAVAIRLRSTYTGNDDYILEFFLPLNMKGNKEQQLLLDSLSGTMQRICESLRTVSKAELLGALDTKVEDYGVTQSLFSRDIPLTSGQQIFAQSKSNGAEQLSPDATNVKADSIERNCFSGQASGLRRPIAKKRSAAEKAVSLNVLQQYFSGSLKDAAKSIGVCPTTLKRICRQHGISRWPSRKINKVNRSLKKIQTVLDSVEGVGGLKYDPSTGELVAAGSIIQEFDPHKSVFMPTRNMAGETSKGEFSTVNLETNSYIIGKQLGSSMKFFGVARDDMDVGKKSEDGVMEHHNTSSSNMTESSNGSGSSTSANNDDKRMSSKKKISIENGASRINVKARYKDDTIRFKFDRFAGCLDLYEEIATRFKLELGSFQLKYLDDEEEWVMLVSDSDLKECLEIMEFVGKPNVKFLVRDMPFSMGSSGGSIRFLS